MGWLYRRKKGIYLFIPQTLKNWITFGFDHIRMNMPKTLTVFFQNPCSMATSALRLGMCKEGNE